MNTCVELSAAELRQLRMAQAIGYTKAAIRRALYLNDPSFLSAALFELEEATR